LAEVGKHEAMVAFQEHGSDHSWQKLKQGKAWISPAPFYLVWKEGKSLPESFPWSYQLVKIELVSFAQKYAKLFPHSIEKDSSVYRGFLVFKERCLRCHSINLQGGELAPELNVPKNITEYWTEENLRAFIYDASSFRAKSKMPIFRNSLKEKEITEILDYLRIMKANKIKD
jgi:mono/diheme cytochrome c family protein